ncbi:hypothetical protein ACJ41O_008987 [Fusarium nematophilum]
MFNNVIDVWFAALFFVFNVALPVSVGVKPDLAFQKASFVFTKWLDQTGWPDGVAWFLGLVQAAYGLTAFNAVIHMIEEIPAPRRNGPRIMYWAVVVVVLFVGNGIGQAIQLMASSSRLTWSFARDGGRPFGPCLSHVDEYWMAPQRALWLQCLIIYLVGVLFLFANTVLEAILSVSTIALTISYAMWISLAIVIGWDKMPRRDFNMGRFGPSINWVSLIFCVITVVFFFPTQPSPPGGDMNYAIYCLWCYARCLG